MDGAAIWNWTFTGVYRGFRQELQKYYFCFNIFQMPYFTCFQWFEFKLLILIVSVEEEKLDRSYWKKSKSKM